MITAGSLEKTAREMLEELEDADEFVYRLLDAEPIDKPTMLWYYLGEQYPEEEDV